MLEIVLTPKILGPPKSGALVLSLFCLMVNPRLTVVQLEITAELLRGGNDLGEMIGKKGTTHSSQRYTASPYVIAKSTLMEKREHIVLQNPHIYRHCVAALWL